MMIVMLMVIVIEMNVTLLTSVKFLDHGFDDDGEYDHKGVDHDNDDYDDNETYF